jgi:hypothetical protein
LILADAPVEIGGDDDVEAHGPTLALAERSCRFRRWRR